MKPGVRMQITCPIPGCEWVMDPGTPESKEQYVQLEEHLERVVHLHLGAHPMTDLLKVLTASTAAARREALRHECDLPEWSPTLAQTYSAARPKECWCGRKWYPVEFEMSDRKTKVRWAFIPELTRY